MDSWLATIFSPGTIIPALGILTPVLIIAVVLHYKNRREQLLMQTVQHLADRGQPVPAELLQPDGAQTRSSPLSVALMLIGLGLGLIVFFLVGLARLQWLWGVGTVPLFIGIGQLVALQIDRRRGAPD
jgi:hypothetical protein